MEHVAATLRGQGGEETERLRQEHHRLQVMQVNARNDVLSNQGNGEGSIPLAIRMISLKKHLSFSIQSSYAFLLLCFCLRCTDYALYMLETVVFGVGAASAAGQVCR